MYYTRLCRQRRKIGILAVALLILVFIPSWFNMPDVNAPPIVSATLSSEKLKAPSSAIASHRLAIIVPYRDRSQELETFVPHISGFLNNQSVNFGIFIINQTDSYRFNRAALINIGFLLSKSKGFDYMAMHDIDLLPIDARLSYSFPINGPMHLSAPHLHPLYHYDTYVGGIFIIKHSDFELINGMSNRYWGWGLEDDEFYTRIRHYKLKLFRPSFNSTSAFKHVHDKKKRKRDFRQKIPSLHKVDRVTGISTLEKDGDHGPLYSLSGSRTIVIQGFAATLYDIVLHCNLSATPWCLPSNVSSTTKKKS